MPQTVDALVTPGAKEPFERRTIERRDPRPEGRRDRHPVRRHLPLRHPPGARRVGRGDLPDGARPRDRRRRHARSAPRSRKYKVGDRVGVGCFVDSCRECENCQAGEEQYCLKGEVADLQRHRSTTARPTYGGYSHADRRRRELRARASPRASRSTRRAAALRRHHAPTRRCNHWGAGPGKKVAIVGMGGLGHMGVKIAAAMGAEVTVLSQTAVEGGGRPKLGADHYYATSDDGDVQGARAAAST